MTGSVPTDARERTPMRPPPPVVTDKLLGTSHASSVFPVIMDENRTL